MLRALVYPVVMAGVVGGAFFALRAGLPVTASLLALQVAGALAVLLLERALPYRAEWLRAKGDVGTDALCLVSSGLMQGLGQLALGLPFLWLAQPRVWPGAWPLLAQLAVALVVAELGVYLLHRIQHQGGLLWRIHAPHHSVPRLYWLNSARSHPLDALLFPFVSLGPLVLLGAGEPLIALVLAFQGTHAFFQHSNVDVRLGPLNLLLSMAEVHRWHHSRVLAEANANYGQTLLVWDHVFRTYSVPRDHEPPADTGLTDLPFFPMAFVGQLLAPFRWRDATRSSP